MHKTRMSKSGTGRRKLSQPLHLHSIFTAKCKWSSYICLAQNTESEASQPLTQNAQDTDVEIWHRLQKVEPATPPSPHNAEDTLTYVWHRPLEAEPDNSFPKMQRIILLMSGTDSWKRGQPLHLHHAMQRILTCVWHRSLEAEPATLQHTLQRMLILMFCTDRWKRKQSLVLHEEAEFQGWELRWTIVLQCLRKQCTWSKGPRFTHIHNHAQYDYTWLCIIHIV